MIRPRHRPLYILVLLSLAVFLLTGCSLYRTMADRLVRLEHPAYPEGIGSPQLKRDLDACGEELKPQSRYFMSTTTAMDLIFACLQRHGWEETAARSVRP